MVVVTANVDVPSMAKGKQVTHLAENSSQFSRNPRTTTQSIFPVRSKTTPLKFRESLAPVVQPSTTHEKSASTQSRSTVRVAFGRAVSQPPLAASARKPTNPCSKTPLRGILKNNNRSSSVPTPSTPLLLNKALPSKPVLRTAYSPDRRSVLDATDMNSRKLDTRFPPLEPTSSSDISKSAQVSPAAGSSIITPSVLPSNQSGDLRDPKVTGHGIAHSASNQSPTNAQLVWRRNAADRDHLDSTGSMRAQKNSHEGVSANHSSSCGLGAGYALNTPGSPEQIYSRWSQEDHSISPSRPSRYSHLNQRPSLSVMSGGINRTTSRNQQSSPSTPRFDGPSNLKPQSFSRMAMNADQSINSDHLSISSIESAGAEKDPFKVQVDTILTKERAPVPKGKDIEEPNSDDDYFGPRRKSKYGYTIRESHDARAVIMGIEEDHQMEARPSRFGSAKFPASQMACDALAETTTLPFRNISASHVPMSPGLSPHPTRLSSLPTNNEFSDGKNFNGSIKVNENSANIVKTTLGSTNSQNANSTSNITPASVGSSKPRKWLFTRQTASSAARASATTKKDGNVGGLGSELTHFRPGSSLSNVSDGMKKLKRKVGKIIPSRHTATRSAPSASILELGQTSRDISRPSDPTEARRASYLLTTYENSGMEDRNFAEDLSFMTPSRRGTIGDELTDKHETTETRNDKEEWERAQQGAVSGEDHIVQFVPTQNRRGVPNGADDDDEPPFTPPVRANQGAHYVEGAEEEGEAPQSSDSEAVAVDESDDSSLTASVAPAAAPPNSPASATGAGNELSGESAVDSPSSSGDADPVASAWLQEADLASRRLMDRALLLGPCPLRTQLVIAAEGLEELVIALREARILAIRVDQSLVNVSVTVANGAARLATVVDEFLAQEG